MLHHWFNLHPYHKSHYLLPNIRQPAIDIKKRFFISTFLHDIGLAMFTIFIGLFIYQLGFGIEGVLICWLAWGVIVIALAHAIRRLVLRWGSVINLAIGVVLQILGGLYVAFILANADSNTWLYLLPVGILDGLGYSFYSFSYNYYYCSQIKSTKREGKQTSALMVLQTIAVFLAPLASGLVAHFFGYLVNIVIAIALMSASLIPLLKASNPEHQRNNRKPNHPVTLKTYQQVLSKIHWKVWLGNAASTWISFMAPWFWMLYVAIAVFAAAPFGILGVLLATSTLISIVVMHFVGKLIDRQYQKYIIKTILPTEIFLAVSRLVIQSPSLIVGHDILQKQANSGIVLLQTRNYYHWGDYFSDTKKLDFLVVDRMLFTLFILTLYTLLYLILVFISSDIEVLRYWTIIPVLVLSPFAFWMLHQKDQPHRRSG